MSSLIPDTNIKVLVEQITCAAQFSDYTLPMKDERSNLDKYKQALNAALFLADFGWKWMGKDMLFIREGYVFDLSAADISRHNQIFLDKLFVVEDILL